MQSRLCQADAPTAVQGIVDVEEHPGGAVSNYVAISEIVKQMQERVNAMRACHSYYISHAFTQVCGTPRQAAVPCPLVHACNTCCTFQAFARVR